MICETPKERIGFLVSSLVTLADMSGSDLRDLTEIVGVDTIQGLLDMEPLPFELSCQEMAGEICAYIGWEPSLSAPCLDICKVDRLGNQIAGMASTLPPAKGTVAERLFSALRSDKVREMVEEYYEDDADGLDRIRFNGLDCRYLQTEFGRQMPLIAGGLLKENIAGFIQSAHDLENMLNENIVI